MKDPNLELSSELLEAEKKALAARLSVDVETIERINYYSPAQGPGRIVMTTVVELKKSE